MIFLPLNLRSLTGIAIVLIIILSYFYFKGNKEKNEYDKITGGITYIDSKYGNWPNRNFGKYRYIQLNNYPYPFEIFIGKDAGDFKPKYEQIDQLKIGDTITVYFYADKREARDGLNTGVHFIDKGNISFYERGDSSKWLLLVMVLISLSMPAIGYVYYRKGKLKF